MPRNSSRRGRRHHRRIPEELATFDDLSESEDSEYEAEEYIPRGTTDKRRCRRCFCWTCWFPQAEDVRNCRDLLLASMLLIWLISNWADKHEELISPWKDYWVQMEPLVRNITAEAVGHVHRFHSRHAPRHNTSHQSPQKASIFPGES